MPTKGTIDVIPIVSNIAANIIMKYKIKNFFFSCLLNSDNNFFSDSFNVFTPLKIKLFTLRKALVKPKLLNLIDSYF